MGKYRVLLFGLFRIFVSMAVDAQQVLPQLPDSAIMLQRKLTKAPALDTLSLPALDTFAVPPFDSISVSVSDQRALHTLDSVVVSAADSLRLSSGTEKGSRDTGTKKELSDSLSLNRSASFFAPETIFKPSPRKAVIYSAIFPGLGQIYNRNYWKLPILYGGFVGFTYAITWNNSHYQDYLGAYIDIMDDNPNTNRWHSLLPYDQKPESVDRNHYKEIFKQRKDFFRYYRDFSIIGTVALYLLAIVDAYVDAQLFDFDMTPDLSMRVQPVLIKQTPHNQLMGGHSLGVLCCFSF